MSKSTNADQENTAEKSNPKTGAQAVVASLEEAGVRVIFGVQGGAIMPVYDALYDSKLEHITMGHEQGAAHAADVEAPRRTGRRCLVGPRQSARVHGVPG